MTTRFSRFRRRLVLACTVPAVAVVGLVAPATGLTAAPADAAPRGGVVVLGDSFASNSPDLSGCSRSAAAWPGQLGKRTGRHVVNEACSGAGIGGNKFTIADEARKAAAKGAFNKGTAAVLIQFGLNGYWGRQEVGINYLQRCMINGCPDPNPTLAAVNPGNFTAKVKPIVDYIRYFAPNARIAIVGYPELVSRSAPDGCINVLGAPITRPGTRGLRGLMEHIQNAHRIGAKSMGVEFVDAWATTRGRGICSPSPLVNGIGNPRADFLGIPIHPSAAGDRHLSGVIARQLRL